MSVKLPTKHVEINTHVTRLWRLRKSVINAARIIHDRLAQGVGSFRFKAVMVTLTYAESSAWEPRHVSDYIKRVREWGRRQGVDLHYVWVAEIQEERRRRTGEAVPHYHLLWWVPRHLQLPMADKRGWWSWGLTRTELARRAVGYVAKYASKDHSKDAGYPKGMRIYGIGGLGAKGRREVRWWNCPQWAREYFGKEADLHRAVGGGFVDRNTGEVKQSDWGFGGAYWTWVQVPGAGMRRVPVVKLVKRDGVTHPGHAAEWAATVDLHEGLTRIESATAWRASEALGERDYLAWVLSLPRSIRLQAE